MTEPAAIISSPASPTQAPMTLVSGTPKSDLVEFIGKVPARSDNQSGGALDTDLNSMRPTDPQSSKLSWADEVIAEKVGLWGGQWCLRKIFNIWMGCSLEESVCGSHHVLFHDCNFLHRLRPYSQGNTFHWRNAVESGVIADFRRGMERGRGTCSLCHGVDYDLLVNLKSQMISEVAWKEVGERVVFDMGRALISFDWA